MAQYDHLALARGRPATTAHSSPAGAGMLSGRGVRSNSRRSREARQRLRRLQLRATWKTQPAGDCMALTLGQCWRARAKASSVQSDASARSPVTSSMVATMRGCWRRYHSSNPASGGPAAKPEEPNPAPVWGWVGFAKCTEVLSHQVFAMLMVPASIELKTGRFLTTIFCFWAG